MDNGLRQYNGNPYYPIYRTSGRGKDCYRQTPVLQRISPSSGNYDGIRKDEVVEIKTTEKLWKTVPKKYWQQCQVLMYRKRKKKTGLYAYQMESEDYASPYFPVIDGKRLKRYEISYDEEFIKNEYIPRLKYLASCLRQKKFPLEKEYEQIHSKVDKETC